MRSENRGGHSSPWRLYNSTSAVWSSFLSRCRVSRGWLESSSTCIQSSEFSNTLLTALEQVKRVLVLSKYRFLIYFRASQLTKMFSGFRIPFSQGALRSYIKLIKPCPVGLQSVSSCQKSSHHFGPSNILCVISYRGMNLVYLPTLTTSGFRYFKDDFVSISCRHWDSVVWCTLDLIMGHSIATNFISFCHTVNLTPPFKIWKVLVVALEQIDYLGNSVCVIIMSDSSKAQKESNQNVSW